MTTVQLALSRVFLIVRLAVAFLTRIPGAHPAQSTPSDFGWAHAAFPVAGLMIGLGIASVQLVALAAGFPPFAAATIALATGALLTGGLHEDGLADTADGFGGGRDREAKLAIMRDSRIGTYGTLAVVLVLMAKVGALAAMTGPAVFAVLAVAHALSRTSTSVLARLVAPARADGLSVPASRPPAAAIAISVAASVVAGALALSPLRMLAAIAACFVVTAAIALTTRRQIGGQTGDVLGATQQLVETAILLVLSAEMPLGA